MTEIAGKPLDATVRHGLGVLTAVAVLCCSTFSAGTASGQLRTTEHPLGPLLSCRHAAGNARQAYWIIEGSAEECEKQKKRLSRVSAEPRARALKCWPPLDAALTEIKTAKPIFEKAMRTPEPAEGDLVREGNHHLKLAGEALEQADQCIRQASGDLFSARSDRDDRRAPYPEGTTVPDPGAPGPEGDHPDQPPPDEIGAWREETYPQVPYRRPQPQTIVRQIGWLKGRVTWNEKAPENPQVTRVGRCAFEYIFYSDGTGRAKDVTYHNDDVSYPFSDQRQVEFIDTLAGTQTPVPFTANLQKMSSPLGGFEINFTNPSFRAESGVQVWIRVDGNWKRDANRDRVGEQRNIHCLFRKFWIGRPSGNAPKQGEQKPQVPVSIQPGLDKQVRRVTIEAIEWAF